MDERFEELARLVGEHLAQRWVERRVQRDHPSDRTAGSDSQVHDRSDADAAPRDVMSEEARA